MGRQSRGGREQRCRGRQARRLRRPAPAALGRGGRLPRVLQLAVEIAGLLRGRQGWHGRCVGGQMCVAQGAAGIGRWQKGVLACGSPAGTPAPAAHALTSAARRASASSAACCARSSSALRAASELRRAGARRRKGGSAQPGRGAACWVGAWGRRDGAPRPALTSGPWQRRPRPPGGLPRRPPPRRGWRRARRAPAGVGRRGGSGRRGRECRVCTCLAGQALCEPAAQTPSRPQPIVSSPTVSASAFFQVSVVSCGGGRVHGGAGWQLRGKRGRNGCASTRADARRSVAAAAASGGSGGAPRSWQ